MIQRYLQAQGEAAATKKIADEVRLLQLFIHLFEILSFRMIVAGMRV